MDMATDDNHHIIDTYMMNLMTEKKTKIPEKFIKEIESKTKKKNAKMIKMIIYFTL